MSLPDFGKLVKLQAFLQQLREVKRAIYLPGKNEKENDVDHSFTLAITASIGRDGAGLRQLFL